MQWGKTDKYSKFDDPEFEYELRQPDLDYLGNVLAAIFGYQIQQDDVGSLAEAVAVIGKSGMLELLRDVKAGASAQGSIMDDGLAEWLRLNDVATSYPVTSPEDMQAVEEFLATLNL